MRVALFITCLTDTYFPRAGIAAVELLEAIGDRVDFPIAQTCCGQPFFNDGDHERTRSLAQKLVEAFEGYEVVVTPSASCAAMLRRHYDALLDHGAIPPAERLSNRCFELFEYLLADDIAASTGLGRLSALGPLSWSGPVTYHYSCHARELELGPRHWERVLPEIRGLQYRPLDDIDECCGFGGTFMAKFAPVAERMTRDKLAAIARTHSAADDATATRVICNEGGCALALLGLAHRRGQRLELMSLAELVAEAAGLLPLSTTACGARR